MNNSLRLIFIFLSLLLLGSCLSEEEFNVKAGLNLKFEKDTLSLDTVITAQPSNTYVVQLHNPNTTGVNISSISLEKG
ncbi:MAG: hypothetical protein HUK09_00510, partial [Bacteroidaceae bacterium]|nr:hypothetical protein [Bacteroidaceae bacterium]